MNLASLSSLRGSQRGAEALGYILQQSPFIAFMDANQGFELDATSFDWRPITGSVSIEARALGGSYTAVDVSPASKQSGNLAIHGIALDYDISHQEDAKRGLRDFSGWFEKNWMRRVRSFAVGYENLLFNGSGLQNNIKGLATILNGTDDIPGYTGQTRVYNAADNGGVGAKSFDLTQSSNYDAFIEMFYNCLSIVENPTGLVVNDKLFAKLQSLAREKNMLGTSKDMYNGIPISTFAGIPMVKVLSETISASEPDDTATPLNITTSMYLLSPGEMRFSLVTNSGLDYMPYDHLENKESGREKLEIRAAWKIEEPKSVLRIRNIKV